MIIYDYKSKEDYLRRREELLQSYVINVKSGNTSTTTYSKWTYRTTACDVISVVTTTVPFECEKMSNIAGDFAEIKRVKPHTKTSDLLAGNPLEDPVVENANGATMHYLKKLNEALNVEKNQFMKKVNYARKFRCKAENVAAVVVQSWFRGYSVRKNLPEIKKTCEIAKSFRKALFSLVKSNAKIVPLSPNLPVQTKQQELYGLGVYRQDYKEKRVSAACCIQRGYRCYHSRQIRKMKAIQAIPVRKRRSAIRIQCLVRRTMARIRVLRLLRSRHEKHCFLSCIKIQNAFRRHAAIRKVRKYRYKLHYVASSMIQCWFRRLWAIYLVNNKKNDRRNIKNVQSAKKIQSIARGYVCRRLNRLLRLRARKLFVRLFKAVVRIQTLIRRFICARRVHAIKKVAKEGKKQRHKERKARREVAAEQVKAHEAKVLMDSMDIYLQTKLGNVSIVTDLLISQCPEVDLTKPETMVLLSANTVPESVTGNTLLMIAAMNGHVELVRKFIVSMGFDVNARNNSDETAFMLAVRYGHYNVVKYLLSLPYVTGITIDDDELSLQTTEVPEGQEGDSLPSVEVSAERTASTEKGAEIIPEKGPELATESAERTSTKEKKEIDETSNSKEGEETTATIPDELPIQQEPEIKEIKPEEPMLIAGPNVIATFTSSDMANMLLDALKVCAFHKGKPSGTAPTPKYVQSEIDTRPHAMLQLLIGSNRFDVLAAHPESGLTALHLACELGDENCFSLLILYLCKSMRVNPSLGGFYSSDFATLSSTNFTFDLKSMKKPKAFLLSEIMQIVDEMGQNCLHKACSGGSIDIICYLMNVKMVREGSEFVYFRSDILPAVAPIDNPEVAVVAPITLPQDAKPEIVENVPVEPQISFTGYKYWTNMLRKQDSDCKDCMLLAAIRNRIEVYKFLECLKLQEKEALRSELRRIKFEAKKAVKLAQLNEEKAARAAEEAAAREAQAAAAMYASPSRGDKGKQPVLDDKNLVSNTQGVVEAVVDVDDLVSESGLDVPDTEIADEQENADIGWSPNDIFNIIKFVIVGNCHGEFAEHVDNFICLKYLLSVGFNPLWSMEIDDAPTPWEVLMNDFHYYDEKARQADFKTEIVMEKYPFVMDTYLSRPGFSDIRAGQSEYSTLLSDRLKQLKWVCAGSNCIMKACVLGNVEILDILLPNVAENKDENTDLVQIVDSHGRNCFHYCILSLLANSNARSSLSQVENSLLDCSSVMAAVLNHEVSNSIIKKANLLTVVDNLGYTILHLAILVQRIYNYLQYLQSFPKQCFSGYSSLPFVFKSLELFFGKEKLIEGMLFRGANGVSPMLLSATIGNMNALRWCLSWIFANSENENGKKIELSIEEQDLSKLYFDNSGKSLLWLLYSRCSLPLSHVFDKSIITITFSVVQPPPDDILCNVISAGCPIFHSEDATKSKPLEGTENTIIPSFYTFFEPTEMSVLDMCFARCCESFPLDPVIQVESLPSAPRSKRSGKSAKRHRSEHGKKRKHKRKSGEASESGTSDAEDDEKLDSPLSTPKRADSGRNIGNSKEDDIGALQLGSLKELDSSPSKDDAVNATPLITPIVTKNLEKSRRSSKETYTKRLVDPGRNILFVSNNFAFVKEVFVKHILNWLIFASKCDQTVLNLDDAWKIALLCIQYSSTEMIEVVEKVIVASDAAGEENLPSVISKSTNFLKNNLLKFYLDAGGVVSLCGGFNGKTFGIFSLPEGTSFGWMKNNRASSAFLTAGSFLPPPIGECKPNTLPPIFSQLQLNAVAYSVLLTFLYKDNALLGWCCKFRNSYCLVSLLSHYYGITNTVLQNLSVCPVLSAKVMSVPASAKKKIATGKEIHLLSPNQVVDGFGNTLLHALSIALSPSDVVTTDYKMPDCLECSLYHEVAYGKYLEGYLPVLTSFASSIYQVDGDMALCEVPITIVDNNAEDTVKLVFNLYADIIKGTLVYLPQQPHYHGGSRGRRRSAFAIPVSKTTFVVSVRRTELNACNDRLQTPVMMAAKTGNFHSFQGLCGKRSVCILERMDALKQKEIIPNIYERILKLGLLGFSAMIDIIDENEGNQVPAVPVSDSKSSNVSRNPSVRPTVVTKAQSLRASMAVKLQDKLSTPPRSMSVSTKPSGSAGKAINLLSGGFDRPPIGLDADSFASIDSQVSVESLLMSRCSTVAPLLHPRDGLSVKGSYAGWVLARTRQVEALETCNNTGSYFDVDDSLYYSVHPDPNFVSI